MFKNLRKKKKGGFTLIELIIVIAIIAILAAVAIPKFGDVRKNAAVKADVANAKSIANAATVLIGEGKITLPLPTTGDDTVINTTIADTPTTTGDKIEAYLQNVPTPKSVSGDFSVEIDEKGNVKVKVGSETFFPATATQVN